MLWCVIEAANLFISAWLSWSYFLAWVCACIKCFTSTCEAYMFWVCIRVVSFKICMTREGLVSFFFAWGSCLSKKKRVSWGRWTRGSPFISFTFISFFLSLSSSCFHDSCVNLPSYVLLRTFKMIQHVHFLVCSYSKQIACFNRNLLSILPYCLNSLRTQHVQSSVCSLIYN